MFCLPLMRKHYAGKTTKDHLLLTFVAIVSLGSASPGVLIIDPELRGPKDGRAIYLAAVAEESPWREPAQEAVVKAAELPIRWHLPAGRYRVVAGAVGLTVVYGQVLDVRPGAAVRAEPVLRQLDWVEGRVADADGRPIAGARVGRLRAWLTAFSRQLSDLGEEHLHASFLATTSDDGRFRLPFLPEAGHVLWIEASGFAPRLLPNVRVPRDIERLASLTLEAGGSLVATWSAGSPELDAGYRLALEPRASERNPVQGIDRRGLAALWERGVESDAIKWSALPAGRYEIVLRGARRGAHATTPRTLATVDLAIGDTMQVILEVPAGASLRDIDEVAAQGTRRAHDRRLALMVDLPGSLLREPPTVGVTCWQQGRGRETVRLLRSVVTSGGRLRIDVAGSCAGRTRFSVEAEASAGASEWQEEPYDQAIPIHLWPAFRAQGNVMLPAGERLPTAGELVASGCETRDHPAREAGFPLAPVLLPFAFGEGGAFSALAPLGCAELSLRVGDLALAPLEVEAPALGSTRNVGTVVLRRGGSALVRVVSAETGLPLVGATVSTLPADLRVKRPIAPESANALIRGTAARTGDDGWARLFGLPEGDRIFVVSEADRIWPYRSEPVRVLAGDELVIDPLEVPSPGQLMVEVQLSNDLAGRGVDEIRVLARQVGSAVALSAEAVVVAGTAVFHALESGVWRLEALVRFGEDQPVAVVGDQEVEIFAGVNVTRLEIEEILFHGRVRHRGKAVVGEASFRPAAVARVRHHKNRTRIGPGGRFRILLEPGTYDVEIWDNEGVVRAVPVPGVELIEPAKLVEIELPEGSISGVVVDADGNAVEAARVSAFQLVELESRAPAPVHRSERSQIDGFRFDAVQEGRWTLWAEDDGARSAYAEIAVAGPTAIEGVRLQLRASRRARLMLDDHLGVPLFNARGTLSFRPQAGAYGPVSALVSRPDGTYWAEVPVELDITVANVMIQSPHLVDAQVASIEDGRRIRFSEPGAQVIASYEADRWERMFGGFLFLVRPDGAFVDLGELARSASAVDEHGRRTIEVGRLGSGAWRVVGATSTMELALVYRGRSMHLPALASFESSAGAVVEIDLSVANEEKGEGVE